MASDSTRNRPGFAGFPGVSGAVPLAATPPPGEGSASPGGAVPRAPRARESRARDFTPAREEAGHAT